LHFARNPNLSDLKDGLIIARLPALAVMKIEQTILTKALEWAYIKALSGVGKFDSAYKLANEFRNKTTSQESAVESLTNWQVAKCATSGFVTGLGGLLTLPVAVPANISSVLLIQLRMILSIAIIGGFDPKSEQVKSLAFICLTGNVAPAILNETGISSGKRLTQEAVQKIGEGVIKRVNYLVKIRLLAKTGKAGIIGFGKAIPLLGGVVGGAIDAFSTQSVANAARRLFIAPLVKR
jgi:hypothetical protein